VQDPEEEIGVDLFRRSRRGLRLTAEGKLFLEEIRKILKHTDEAVEKVRALTRGQYGELHVGYAAAPTVEILPAALAAFQKAFPRVEVVLHDLMRNELMAGLQDGTLELAMTPGAADSMPDGIEFEVLMSYPFCVVLPPRHRLSRLRTVPLERVSAEPLIGLRRKENPGYYKVLDRAFASARVKPRFAVECDTLSSLITTVEAGRGIAVAIPTFRQVSGTRLVYRRLAGTNEVFSVGIARAKEGDVTPAGEKFCEILRAVAKARRSGKPSSTAA